MRTYHTLHKHTCVLNNNQLGLKSHLHNMCINYIAHCPRPGQSTRKQFLGSHALISGSDRNRTDRPTNRPTVRASERIDLTLTGHCKLDASRIGRSVGSLNWFLQCACAPERKYTGCIMLATSHMRRRLNHKRALLRLMAAGAVLN